MLCPHQCAEYQRIAKASEADPQACGDGWREGMLSVDRPIPAELLLQCYGATDHGGRSA